MLTEEDFTNAPDGAVLWPVQGNGYWHEYPVYHPYIKVAGQWWGYWPADHKDIDLRVANVTRFPDRGHILSDGGVAYSPTSPYELARYWGHWEMRNYTTLHDLILEHTGG